MPNSFKKDIGERDPSLCIFWESTFKLFGDCNKAKFLPEEYGLEFADGLILIIFADECEFRVELLRLESSLRFKMVGGEESVLNL